jgi:hypothetical protein
MPAMGRVGVKNVDQLMMNGVIINAVVASKRESTLQ